MRALVTAIAMAALGPTGALAAPMVSSTNPESVMAAAKAAGFTTTFEATQPGDSPLLKLSQGTAAWYIRFNECTKGANCKSLYLDAEYSLNNISPQEINDKFYNAASTRVSFYVNHQGKLQMNAEMNFAGGPVSQAFFIGTLQGWISFASKWVDVLYRR